MINSRGKNEMKNVKMEKFKMKKILSLLLAVGLLLALSACPFGSGETVSSAEPEPVESTAAASSTGLDGYRNPLTGEETETDISRNCPVGVMLNNVKEALPQSGNSKADMFYEVPEEGGITRILALFQDVTGVGQIGTVRSTRPYFVRLAVGQDALLTHCGGSNQAYVIIKKYMEKADFNDIDCLNHGTNCAYSYFKRSEARLNAGFALENTMYIHSDNIQAFLEKNKDTIRTTHKPDYAPAQQFVEDGTPAQGSSAKSIDVVMSQYKHTLFDYDESTGSYGVTEFGSPYIDEVTGEQIHVENVVVLLTDISVNEQSKLGHLSVVLTGTGTGYYACGGKFIPITWEKKSVEDQQRFYDQDGNQIKFGIGKTYICVVDKARNITMDEVVQPKPADANEADTQVDSMAQVN